MPFQNIDGQPLYYEWHGADSAKPIVFINGLLADTTGWLYQQPVFAERFRVLLYDCRGQGQSSPPSHAPYPPAQHARDLLALCDSLNLTRFSLVGLSNGGAVAQHLAVAQPQRVERLVLASTYAAIDALMRAKLQSWLLALEQGGSLMRFDMATPWVWGRDFLAQHESLLASLRAKAARAPIETLRALITGALDHEMHQQLAEITAPTLVITGEEDVLTPPWYARELAGALPNAHLILVPQAGHALPIERPALFNTRVLAFLARTESEQREKP